jgi:UDPglucose--hexose-1-phosphate uridylyltransferase
VIAPRRADRPGGRAPGIEPETPAELDACPFCAGREDRTPPETLRIGEPWRVRVVPNLYPAFERQEVVVHSPRHVRSFAELEDDEVALVAEAWQRRARDVAGSYVHALVNEGRTAGASLAHSHSQLVWMHEPPPAVGDEADAWARIAELLKTAGGKLEVESAGDMVLLCPPAGRVPYEMLITSAGPREADAFTSERLGPGLSLLRSAIRRLRQLEGPVPWNAWLHNGSAWHIEIVPRLTVFAGIELGAGIYVNPLPPEQAAAALRDATAS